MLISIFLYCFFAFVIYTLGKNEWIVTQKNQHASAVNSHWGPSAYILIFFFIIISGLRYRVGVDCESYVNILKEGPSNFHYDRLEPFFKAIVDSLRVIFPSRIIYLSVLAALEIIPFYYALRTRKFLYPYFGILLFMGPFYLIWMNGIRQSIAACFFVLAAVILVDGVKNRRLISALLIIFAAQFHTSAYVLLVFLFFPVNCDLFRNRFVNIVILLVCAVVGQTEFLSTFIGSYTDVEIGGFYSNYNIDIILAQDAYMPYGPRRIVILLLCMMTIWFAPEMKKQFKDYFFLFSFNLFFIHACLCENLFSNVSFIFRRPFYYTFPFEMICFSYLLFFLNNGGRGKDRKPLYMAAICLLCLYVMVLCIADAGSSTESSLYKFIFFNS